MNLIDYVRFESAEVGYNVEGGYVSIKYFKESSSEDYRAHWTYALDLRLKYNASKWFIDKRRQNIYPADYKWLKAVLYKKAVELNPLSKEHPRYMAYIMPANFYSEYITTEFIDEHSWGGLKFNTLKTTEEAHNWLLQLHCKASQQQVLNS